MGAQLTSLALLAAMAWPLLATGDEAPPHAERPVRALIITGHNHPAHDWRETTAALKETLAADERFRVEVATDPEALAKATLSDFDVVVFNYCNWERPGLSNSAKRNLVKYLGSGGGLVLVHFANGAFHFSLPKAGESDWPEWRTRICRRTWDHTPGKSGHDARGPFRVSILKKDHPITRGIEDFDTTDELYFRQQGDESVSVLATARSKVTGRDEPMAMVYDYANGRVFQTVLGHDAAALRTPGTAALVCRGAAWAAARTPADVTPTPLVPGKFGKALDARRFHAEVAYRPELQRPPLTVECWAKLDSATGYNLLVANNAKESATHWELFTMAGNGHFTAYLPGRKPDHVHSGVAICDGKWHHLAMVYEADRVRLYSDGKQTADMRVADAGGAAREGPLWLGAYPPGNLGCAGVVDDVRLRRGAHPITALPERAAVVDTDTLGLWHLDETDKKKTADAAHKDRPAFLRSAGAATAPAKAGPSSPTKLDYRPASPGLKAILIDRSADESYVSIKADSQRRLFVGGREALFVFEPHDRGGYRRRELYRFPPDSWLAGIELRGNDLYVLTAAALYLVPEGRVKRDGLRPRRILWGLPLDLHVSFHCLAWGPEGDLYLNHGDPLLHYGDFSRPDHWGHWTLFAGPDGTKVPFTGSGAVLRVRADGSRPRVVSRGLRGPFGLAFDRNWELFTNDNDHESMPHLYTPARLLHVTPHANFSWPRGWTATRAVGRADVLETMLEVPGRGVPVGMAYYDDPFLPDIRRQLLQARWDRRTITRHPVAARGASYESEDLPFLSGTGNARPVGVAVGCGGRVFAVISYMAGNEASPHYTSDLVMITRADDPATAPYEALDLTTASPEKLWAELSHSSWHRRLEAHSELLRRGGDVLGDAVRRLATVKEDDPALLHLPWLAAASGSKEAVRAIEALARHARWEARLQAVRAATAFPALGLLHEVAIGAIEDASPRVQLAALAALFEDRGELPIATLERIAATSDSYLRQTLASLLARRATLAQVQRFVGSDAAAIRLLGGLAVGFRLTVPPPDYVPSRELRLSYPAESAFFKLQMRFADGEADLRTLGRGGSFTTAELWKSIKPDREQTALFDLLVERLHDTSPTVQAQAAYFLGLLRDPRSEPAVTATLRSLTEGALAKSPSRPVERAWVAGPFPDGAGPTLLPHPPEEAAIDLEATYRTSRGPVTWKEVTGREGTFELRSAAPDERSSAYLLFGLHSFNRQPAVLLVEHGQKVWHNGRPITDGAGALRLDLQPGSNDVLVRATASRVRLRFKAANAVSQSLPEKLSSTSLAARLKEAGGGRDVPAAFVALDWQAEAKKGDPVRGRKLFGALACTKCHSITTDQAGGGAPSLADAGKRFTVAYLVESVLAPSRQVAEPFRASLLVTKQGQTLTGLIVSETADRIELLLSDGSRRSVAAKDVEERSLSKLSPMPAGLVRTPEELRDLLAYLRSDNPLPP